MEVNPLADASLRQALMQLVSANLQPRLAAELISKTMESLAQSQPSQTTVQVAQTSVAATDSPHIDIVA